jgi:peptidyl-tRNA hydrolase, PTH2 family
MAEEKHTMNYKQIILLRTDLDMSCGKKCVQVAHASMMACDKLAEIWDIQKGVDEWKHEGMRKVVLKVQSKEELDRFVNRAKDLCINSIYVVDYGLTQLEPNTTTAVGFLPFKVDSDNGRKLTELTKELKLL